MRSLILAAAVTLATAISAAAVPVDPSNASGAAAVIGPDAIGSPYVLATTGDVYRLDNQAWAWVHDPYFDVPIPVAEIQDWTPSFIVATNGTWWYRRPGAGEVWEIVPTLPFPPVATNTRTLGDVKKGYR